MPRLQSPLWRPNNALLGCPPYRIVRRTVTSEASASRQHGWPIRAAVWPDGRNPGTGDATSPQKAPCESLNAAHLQQFSRNNESLHLGSSFPNPIPSSVAINAL